MSRRTGSQCNASPKPPSRAASIPEVVVFHAQGCHLCDVAVTRLRDLQTELDFTLREVDIGGDDELEAKYREWLPVVEIDGQRKFTYHLHVDAFRRAVAQANAES